MKTPSIRRPSKHLLPKVLAGAARAPPRTVRTMRTTRNIDQKSVSSFVVYATEPPLSNELVRTAFHGTSPVLPAGFYSSHTPTLRPFNHLVFRARHREPPRQPQSFLR